MQKHKNTNVVSYVHTYTCTARYHSAAAIRQNDVPSANALPPPNGVWANLPPSYVCMAFANVLTEFDGTYPRLYAHQPGQTTGMQRACFKYMRDDTTHLASLYMYTCAYITAHAAFRSNNL